MFQKTNRLAILALFFCCAGIAAAQIKIPPLPAAVSNNAVATGRTGKHEQLYSFMGIGPKKTWDTISNEAYAFDLGSKQWTKLHPVPGPAGRVGASAVEARGEIFLLGGYTVDGRGDELTIRDISVYSPVNKKWFRATDLPIPVADAVVAVYHDRYLYVLGGRSGKDPVPNVQIYDIAKNHWEQATPMPGTPVFGHAGALLDDTIVFVNGAKTNPEGNPRYIASEDCWVGKIDHKNVKVIHWSDIIGHPGGGRFRIAAGVSEKDRRIYFSGGTDNPYNFNGVGYDGQPAEPVSTTFDFSVKDGVWEMVTEDTPNPTMDHRGLLEINDGMVVIGGMEKAQKVTDQIEVVPRKER
jgi:N-acetylneuraminic acid mutarotase